MLAPVPMPVLAATEEYEAFEPREFAFVNIALIALWLTLALLIGRQFARRAQTD